jgi:hypothetical protein
LFFEIVDFGRDTAVGVVVTRVGIPVAVIAVQTSFASETVIDLL